MNPGKLQYAENEGTYVLKLSGEVRLNLCSSLELFLDRMFSEPGFKSVIIDLSATETIDSTSLGLLARLSIQAKKQFGLTPVIISTHEDITRILMSMGFDSVFNIVEQLEGLENLNLALNSIGCDSADEQTAQAQRVIDAHKVLMSMNEENQKAFGELVSQLEEVQSRQES
ncbi:anti-anti-sigma factor [Endozoicomonas sp. OPT23]|uniref:STAS domain-containing protein n=1 Tax=Endozoicomonas sp. OPT23 TaxID=2072845 RepID=UPI00129BA0ED|nr:STAS domain-containing protein [Endozoicomonas sp. OPT23]MRI34682.1 anti-anti-sigma factor [Endozoicomonas sp. OPT23]